MYVWQGMQGQGWGMMQTQECNLTPNRSYLRVSETSIAEEVARRSEIFVLYDGSI